MHFIFNRFSFRFSPKGCRSKLPKKCKKWEVGHQLFLIPIGQLFLNCFCWNCFLILFFRMGKFLNYLFNRVGRNLVISLFWIQNFFPAWYRKTRWKCFSAFSFFSCVWPWEWRKKQISIVFFTCYKLCILNIYACSRIGCANFKFKYFYPLFICVRK